VCLLLGRKLKLHGPKESGFGDAGHGRGGGNWGEEREGSLNLKGTLSLGSGKELCRWEKLL